MKNTKEVKKLKRKNFFFMGLINLSIIICTYNIMPIIFNYPPYTESNLKFQNEIEKLNHVQQYVIIFILLTIIFTIITNLLMKNIYNFLNKFYRKQKITKDEIKNVRKDCFNIPYLFYLSEIIVSWSMGISISLVLGVSNIIILKFALLLIAIVSLISLLQFIFLQKNLREIALLTYTKDHSYEKHPGFRLKFSITLIMQIIPFLAVSIILISLVGYAKTTQEKGNSIMNYYKAYLDNMDFQTFSIESLSDELDKIPLYDKSNYYVIIPPNQNEAYTSSPNTKVSHFFLTYLKYFFYDTDGMVYEYYGTEQQAYMIELEDSNGENWYVGFEYIITDYPLMYFYIAIIIIVALLYIIFLYIWSRNTSTNISTISESLEHVLQENDYTTQQFLPILSNDEFGDLAYSYNKIEELTNQHLKEIQDNQDMMIEQERLASLRPNDWWNCAQSKNTYFFCCRWFRRFIRFNK